MGGVQVAPEWVKVLNPAFDVTPAELVTGIITEKGIVTAPYDEGLRGFLRCGRVATLAEERRP